jgi:hypothetical protein
VAGPFFADRTGYVRPLYLKENQLFNFSVDFLVDSMSEGGLILTWVYSGERWLYKGRLNFIQFYWAFTLVISGLEKRAAF